MIFVKCIILRNMLFLVSLFLLMNSCSSSKEESGEIQSYQPLYKKIAEEKFNNDYKIAFNKDSTYIIIYYYTQGNSKQQNSPLRFFVYNSGTNETIFQDNLANGDVKWINNYQFKVSTIPGIVKGNEDGNKEIFGYVYDVISKRKLSNLDKNQ